jgi:hypothetical protein
MPPFMGHVTASHPAKVLRAGYVDAIDAAPRQTLTPTLSHSERE